MDTFIVRQVADNFIIFEKIFNRIIAASKQQQVQKVLWTQKGVHATVVTAGHCTHAELTSGLAAGMLWLAVTAVACTPAFYAN